MAVKKCCIKNCKSCSMRKEDVGVTYHKFPRDVALRDSWITITRHKHINIDTPQYVCSRHFRKTDFQIFKDSKYMLKSDAIPSIFDWSITRQTRSGSKMDVECADEIPNDDSTDVSLNNSKESEPENVDAIKKFIEDQEKAISEQKLEESAHTEDTELNEDIDKNESGAVQKMDEDNDGVNVGANDNNPNIDVNYFKDGTDLKNCNEDDFNVQTIRDSNAEAVINNINTPNKDYDDKVDIPKVSLNETLSVASGVLDMILSQSEVKISKKKDEKSQLKKNLRSVDKGNSSVSLSVGSKVEAKDFEESWHPAQITEVDYDEMEVLVHYQDVTKKHDEWISVSSPRLRPLNDPPEEKEIQEKRDKPEPTPSTSAALPTSQVDDEAKLEEKASLTFLVGERCLARWKDNRRFTASITNILGKGCYEVMFDDGVTWKCTSSRLNKLKTEQASKATTSPSIPQGPTNAPLPSPISLGPAFHTHLFDPTRDHLGSKSERREMKRKLNIKEIFNIGMKKRKKTPEIQPVKVEKKPKIISKKKIKEEIDTKAGVKTEVRKLQESVASIIGTMSKIEHVERNEILKEELQEVKEEFDKDAKDDQNSVTKNSTGFASDSNDASNDKIDYDPVEKEEVKLVRFEPDEVKHAEVIDIIDRIKEEISKLEESSIKEIDSKTTARIDSPQPKNVLEPEKTESIVEINKEDKTIEENEIIVKYEILDIPKPVEVTEAKKSVTGDLPEESKQEVIETKETPTTEPDNVTEKKLLIKIKPLKSSSKVKKGKKLKLLHEKKVKKEVNKVRSELLEMRKQMEEIKKQIYLKTDKPMKSPKPTEILQNDLLPGEWCCKWVNGQPVGQVSELESEIKVDSNNKPGLPRRSVQVEDERLPPEWTKHMVRRSFGHSAGKWDVVLVSQDNRRFHTKADIRNYLETYPDDSLKPYEQALLDFGTHQKLSRRMGWMIETPGGEVDNPVTVGVLSSTSPLLKTKKFTLKKRSVVEGKRRTLSLKKRLKSKRKFTLDSMPGTSRSLNDMDLDLSLNSAESSYDNSTLEDGYVYVGSLKVQVIDTLLRCPADGCFKNFRNNTLLQMHIKHYHRELRKLMGVTPKVLDLAYARTKAEETETHRQRTDNHQSQIIKVKLPKSKRLEDKHETLKVEINETPIPPIKPQYVLGEKIPRSQDSPKLRKVFSVKPKRPKVLLPVRRGHEQEDIPDFLKEDVDFEPENVPEMPVMDVSNIEHLDYETAISTHTVTKPDKKKRSEKRIFAVMPKKSASEDDEWYNMNSDVETMSSYPRSGTPDSKTMDSKSEKAVESTEEQKESTYTYENGERIKIVHMKREEIINCHCAFREEDGLMVQCELCLCWQHGLCHNIHKESDVPEKYTCSICLNPKRGRRSQRFLHDQDRLYEGLLPGARPSESLRRSHELSGNLLRIEDALHALRVKYYVATKKCHPKLYLWAKDWENGEINMTIEKLNSDYSDLNIMINNVGKENLPMRSEELRDLPLTIDDQDNERLSQKDGQFGSQSLLSGLLSSPGGTSLDLPISTSELEKLAKSVQEQEVRAPSGPQPEAAIENSVCRERLLRHVQRCQALIDARLDSIEAQVAELESQDPSFEDDETADYFPRTKQTIQMLMRDLDTMEELGILT